MAFERDERDLYGWSYMIPLDIIITIVCSVFASSGFWAYLMSKQNRNTAEQRLILGIGYYSICDLAGRYISRGHITRQEYADFKKYLYEPYRARGGNGTAERLMAEIDKLPIREE